MNKITAGIITSVFGISISFAAETTVTIKSTSSDKTHGKVVFTDTPHGLLITPELNNLSPGLHGFHLHENPDCTNQGKAAGGHLDSQNTKTHQGPYKNGHLGDLPVLYVDKEGKANTPTLAPRLKTDQLKNRAVIIHEGGDNYSDEPELGGGGARIACGIINGKAE